MLPELFEKLFADDNLGARRLDLTSWNGASSSAVSAIVASSSRVAVLMARAGRMSVMGGRYSTLMVWDEKVQSVISGSNTKVGRRNHRSPPLRSPAHSRLLKRHTTALILTHNATFHLSIGSGYIDSFRLVRG